MDLFLGEYDIDDFDMEVSKEEVDQQIKQRIRKKRDKK